MVTSGVKGAGLWIAGGVGWRQMGGKTERVTCVDDEDVDEDGTRIFACRGFGLPHVPGTGRGRVATTGRLV